MVQHDQRLLHTKEMAVKDRGKDLLRHKVCLVYEMLFFFLLFNISLHGAEQRTQDRTGSLLWRAYNQIFKKEKQKEGERGTGKGMSRKCAVGQ